MYFSEVGQKMESAEYNARIKIKINIYSYPIFFCVTEFLWLILILRFYEPFCLKLFT